MYIVSFSLVRRWFIDINNDSLLKYNTQCCKFTDYYLAETNPERITYSRRKVYLVKINLESNINIKWNKRDYFSQRLTFLARDFLTLRLERVVGHGNREAQEVGWENSRALWNTQLES